MNVLFTRAKKQLLHRRGTLERTGGEIAQIDAALARIEAGTYGECERCGRAIGMQRLRAIPEARRCIGCTDE